VGSSPTSATNLMKYIFITCKDFDTGEAHVGLAKLTDDTKYPYDIHWYDEASDTLFEDPFSHKQFELEGITFHKAIPKKYQKIYRKLLKKINR
jgi:hypothetical protein